METAMDTKLERKRAVKAAKKPSEVVRRPGAPQWVIDRDERVFALRVTEKLKFQEIRLRLQLRSKEHARACFMKACRRRRAAGRFEALPPCDNGAGPEFWWATKIAEYRNAIQGTGRPSNSFC
jgi:hypothetical protein